MAFTVVDSISLASGEINEDRSGHHGGLLAWVIDGATDVLEQRLVGNGSDAAWFAEAAHNAMAMIAGADSPSDHLSDLPARLCEAVSEEFARAAFRQPAGRHEHPSATALIVRALDRRIEYVAIGDCALIARPGGVLHSVGLGGKEAGDRSTAQVLTSFQAQNGSASPDEAKAHMWPKILAQRARINMPDGYGALSLTSPPAQFVVSGSFEVSPGDHVLIATDGLTRLIEIYQRYEASQLLDAAIGRGLKSLIRELREVETADASCRTYPRVKATDDATALLLEII